MSEIKTHLSHVKSTLKSYSYNFIEKRGLWKFISSVNLGLVHK